MLGTHDIISTSIGLTSDNSNFRYGGFAISIKQFRTITNDTAIFLINSRKESRHIDQSQKRYIKSITETDKTGGFYRSVDIQCPCQHQRLIGHYTNRLSVQTDISGNDIRSKFRLKFKEVVIVGNCFYHLLYIIGLIWIGRHQVRKFRYQASRRIVGNNERWLFHIVSRQIGNKFTDVIDTFDIILSRQMRHTRFCHVDTYPA